MRVLLGHGGSISCVVFSPDASVVITGAHHARDFPPDCACRNALTAAPNPHSCECGAARCPSAIVKSIPSCHFPVHFPSRRSRRPGVLLACVRRCPRGGWRRARRRRVRACRVWERTPPLLDRWRQWGAPVMCFCNPSETSESVVSEHQQQNYTGSLLSFLSPCHRSSQVRMWRVPRHNPRSSTLRCRFVLEVREDLYPRQAARSGLHSSDFG